MKLLGILALLIAYLVVNAKAQRTTFKGTTVKHDATPAVKSNVTTLKVPTTLKKNATMTSKIPNTPKKTTTPLKPKTTTTVKRNATTTTQKPTTIPNSFLCRDKNSSAINGILLPYRNVAMDTTRDCVFFIIAPPGQQVQVTCSNLDLTSNFYSSLRITGSVDAIDEYSNVNDVVEVEVNREYYSITNNLSLSSSYDYRGWFECKWNILPKDDTTHFKLCRHAEAKTENGTIQPLSKGNDTGPTRYCSMSITVPFDNQIEFFCSSITGNNILIVNSLIEFYLPYKKKENEGNRSDRYDDNGEEDGNFYVASNRKYYSTANILTVTSSTKYSTDWFNCSWKAIPKENTTQSKLCRHAEATAANGTITIGDTIPTQSCIFNIYAALDQEIKIVCSVIDLTSSGGYFNFFRTAELIEQPVINRAYYSLPDNYMYLLTHFGREDRISCQWTTTPRENKTNLEACRDGVAGIPRTANGTFQPAADRPAEETQFCDFLITAPVDYQILFSCTHFDGEFTVFGILEQNVYSIELNRVYSSNLRNQIEIYTGVSKPDWFYCEWSVAPREITPNSKLCRHAKSTTANGTITPISMEMETPEECLFVINAPPDQMLQISCSTLNFTNPTSYVKITGVIDYGYNYVFNYYDDLQLIVNRVYTATAENEIKLNTLMNYGNWIECQWTTTPKKNTTDFKLCRDEVAKTNGTIQPLAGNIGTRRNCLFAIQTSSSDQQIQMSCSAIKLNNSTLSIKGTNDDFELVSNRIYTSYSKISINAKIASGDWIDCKWNITPAKNTSDFKLCRDIEARTANGTIQTLSGDPGPQRQCSFSIYASSNQQIQISCSVVKLSSSGFFFFSEVAETAQRPILNRVYLSSSNQLTLYSATTDDKGDKIVCNWTTIPEEITPNSKFCRHHHATTADGTITSPNVTSQEPQRKCDFIIQANLDQQIQFSCSTLHFVSSKSYFNFGGAIDGRFELSSGTSVTLNRLYYSTRDNFLYLNSQIGFLDTFNCSWSIIPVEITPNSKLCRHAEATTANGTITPIAGSTGPLRKCSFRIKAYPRTKIQISCSVLKLSSASSFEISGVSYSGQSIKPPVLNLVYNSTYDIIVSSSFQKSDLFNCSWTTTPSISY